MKTITIDIETYSDIDISKSGLYKYVESPVFEILLFSYKVDNDAVICVDMAQGEAIPPDIIEALRDKTVTKRAWNAAFEITCLRRAGFDTDERGWVDDMAIAAYSGYPAGLDACSKALGLSEDTAKLRTGKALITYFCKPCKATRSNGGRERNLPHHDPDKWELFKEYNKRDVIAEYTISKIFSDVVFPEREQRLWELDVRMNRHGVALDMDLVQAAIELDEVSRETALRTLKNITNLANPNSREQLLSYINNDLDTSMDNLTKDLVSDTLANSDNEKLLEVLKLRREISKSSTKKYEAMAKVCCSDGKAHGLMQYYGANKTGRYTSRLIQVQNLPQNKIPRLDIARRFIKSREVDVLELFYGIGLSDILSQLIRTALVPEKGKSFAIADYSAIEARVVAWLAGEAWVLDVFKGDGKIYEATAARMFNVPIETIAKDKENYALRAKGKIATLALGYQGGVSALNAMGADKMGLSVEELNSIVNLWRANNTNIKSLWRKLENAVKFVIASPGQRANVNNKLKIGIIRLNGANALTIELPSGRCLFYPEIRLTGNGDITFKGVNQTNKTWGSIETYGGKLTENVVQAIARDCLCETLLALDEAGLHTVFHVHDEIIVESSTASESLEIMLGAMKKPISWADGDLVLKGEGFITEFYKKD